MEKMTIEQQKEEFKDILRPWLDETYLELRDDYVDNIFEVRSGMVEKAFVEPLCMIDYKRLLLKEISNSHASVQKANLEITDEELEQNRFLTGENKGRKVTKILSELIAGEYNRTDQRLDYFNKLRKKNISYFISGEPLDFLSAYSVIETCLSPGGCNQSNLIKMLFSPYSYIATDESKTVRMLIYANYERKQVVLNNIYGSYDEMFAMSIVKHYRDLGFDFHTNLNEIFDTEYLGYVDTYQGRFLHYAKALNANVVNDSVMERIDLFERPSWVTYKGDGFVQTFDDVKTSNFTLYSEFHDSSGIRYKHEHYCNSCGNIVNDDEFDFDYEECQDCAGRHNYCRSCDSDNICDDDFDFDRDVCNNCARQEIEIENNVCEVCGDGFVDDEFNHEERLCTDCYALHLENQVEEEYSVK